MARSIAHICSVSMEFTRKGGEPYWEWLYAVPLLHQLQLDDRVVHDYMSVDPSKPNWGTEGLDMNKLIEFKERVQKQRYMYNYALLHSMSLTCYICMVQLNFSLTLVCTILM